MCRLDTICAKRGEIHAVAMKSAVAVLLTACLPLVASAGASGERAPLENERAAYGAALLPEFKFDAKTPPMLLLHGDTDDIASSLGSVKLYEELYRRKIPAQLVIYSNAAHGLNDNVNVHGWESRILDWLQSRKF